MFGGQRLFFREYNLPQRVVGGIREPEEKACRACRRGTDLEEQRIPALLKSQGGAMGPRIAQADEGVCEWCWNASFPFSQSFTLSATASAAKIFRLSGDQTKLKA